MRHPLPFVVVGNPRTGSTLLYTGLCQHPKVRMYNELMHPVDAERAGNHAICRGGSVRLYYDGSGDAIEFLAEQVFERPGETATAVGFKLHGDYKRCDGTENLYARLKGSLPYLRAIHIVRQNYLDVLISISVAKATNRWMQPAGTGHPEAPPRLHITPESASAFFERLTEADAVLSKSFGGPLYARIDYSSLAADFAGEMARVFHFLGLDACPVRMEIEKQMIWTRREIVENYAELEDAFAGSRFALFFSAA